MPIQAAMSSSAVHSLPIKHITFPAPYCCILVSKTQGWAHGSFVEAEAEVKADRSRQRRGKAAMSLTEARQGGDRGRELEAEARQTKFEERPRRGDPLKKPSFP